MRIVYVRTDGSTTTGLGHLFRCLSLAEMLVSQFKIKFLLSAATPEEMFTKINFANVSYEYLDTATEEEEIDQLSALIKEDQLLVIDSYRFSNQYFLILKQRGLRTVVIDDQNNTSLEGLAVINHLVGSELVPYSPQIKFKLLGPAFAILRKEFLAAARQPSPVPWELILNRVIICLGGADPVNRTDHILVSLKRIIPHASIRIIVGAGYKGWSVLQESARAYTDVAILTGLNASEIIREVSVSNLAVITPGMISYEFFSVGIPCLCGYISSTQMHVVKQFEDCGLITNVGCFEFDDLMAGIQATTYEIAISQLATQRQLFDGKSNERLMTAFHEMYD